MRQAQEQGFTKALTIVFELLKVIFGTGIDLDCVDGLVRHSFSRLAALLWQIHQSRACCHALLEAIA